MLGLKPTKVQSISSVSLAGLPTDTRVLSGSNRRTSKGSLSGSLAGFEQLEVQILFSLNYNHFEVGLNFIFLCFKLIIVHYYTQKPK